LTFLLPSAHQFSISAAIHFKTEQLEGALITLSNDDVLNTFDESAWFDEKPLLASKYGGRAWAQIGNVRIELTHAMLSKLAQHIRRVRERWLATVSYRLRELEAEGYQFVDQEHVKLGRITAEMWRHMIHFAIEHDFDKGDSQWHIFDSSTAAVKVYTDQQTTEMDRGHHLI